MGLPRTVKEKNNVVLSYITTVRSADGWRTRMGSVDTDGFSETPHPSSVSGWHKKMGLPRTVKEEKNLVLSYITAVRDERTYTSTYKFCLTQVGWLFSGWTVSIWRHGNWTNGSRFLIRENPNCTILPLHSSNQESASEKIPIAPFYHWQIPVTRNLHRENPSCTILPLDSSNQESAQSPGYWNPMVKWCNWDFLWSVRSSDGWRTRMGSEDTVGFSETRPSVIRKRMT